MFSTEGSSVIAGIDFGISGCTAPSLSYRDTLQSSVNGYLNKNKIKTMAYISPVAEALLDKDTAILLKAGFLERDLANTTGEGYRALAAIMIKAHKAEFIAAAQAAIDAQKADK